MFTCTFVDARIISLLRLPKALLTGIPRSSEIAPTWEPIVELSLGPYGGPRGGSCLSYDSLGQILVLACKSMPFKLFKLFLVAEVDGDSREVVVAPCICGFRAYGTGVPRL